MVRAARCITRFRTTVVGVGCPGRIVQVAGREPDLTYTVSFLPVRLRGAAVTVSGLTVFDVETTQSHLVCELPRERNQDDQG